MSTVHQTLLAVAPERRHEPTRVMTRTANCDFSGDGGLLNTRIYFISEAKQPLHGQAVRTVRSPPPLLTRAGRRSAPTFQPSPHWEARHRRHQEKMDHLMRHDIQTSINSIGMQKSWTIMKSRFSKKSSCSCNYQELQTYTYCIY